MTLGKSNKFIKQLNRRKKIDTFEKKTWFNLTAPSIFTNRSIGRTVANQSHSKFKSEDSLRGRRVEINLGDLEKTEVNSDDRVFAFRVPSQGSDIGSINSTECKTIFDGYRMTTHKRKSLAKKHQTMIETFHKVKMNDSIIIRFKVICFTDSKEKLYFRTKASSVKKRNVKRIQKMIKRKLEEFKDKNSNDLIKMLKDKSLETKMMNGTKNIIAIKDMLIEKVKVLGYGENKIQEIYELQQK